MLGEVLVTIVVVVVITFCSKLDKIVGESPFMERIKKAESSDSDLNNLLLAIVFRDENWLTDYLEGHQGQVWYFKKHNH